ncbi:hypothetical protein K1719_010919 [Acacia pycnantha]|nr:hypothetical protein K1719_010919 [Acacia pycnantha]
MSPLTHRDEGRDVVSPTCSLISTAWFWRVETSKPCNRLASVSCVIWRANEIPGHILLPAPKCWPLKSIFLWIVRNLSGLNSKGSSYTRGSRWIFESLVKRRVPSSPKSVSFFAWTGDGQTTFHSHSDISEVVFNYNHPAVVDFRLKLNISSWMGPP